MKPVTQTHVAGCGVACVASLCGIPYKRAFTLFTKKTSGTTFGYYCKDIRNALKKRKLDYCWKKISPKTRHLLEKEGVIVFIARSRKYPAGHYLLKTGRGWMNPWINFPDIAPARSGYQKTLPGKPQWIIFPASLLLKK